MSMGGSFFHCCSKSGERLIADDCGSYCCQGALQALSAGYSSSMMPFADVLACCFSCDRTPMPISLMKEKMPNIYTELHDTVKMLEDHMRDMQVGPRTARTRSVLLLQQPPWGHLQLSGEVSGGPFIQLFHLQHLDIDRF
jgi:hypothetical protein